MNIQSLGWNSRWDERFKAHDKENLVPARVIREHRNLYTLMGNDGELDGELSGRLRFEAASRRDFPAVGDWVAISARPSEGKGTIQAILPRKSLFSRKEAGNRTEEQVIAANVDITFLLTGLDRDFNLRRIERYLTLTWESGTSPVVLLNKSDLCSDTVEKRAAVMAVAIGVPVHAISAQNQSGLEALDQYLKPGVTIALLGSSGVGKSTLINALLGSDRLKVGAVRDSDGRGRHTTTSRELLLLPSGAIIIDTPGMKELQLWADEGSLQETFEDIERFAEDCRFSDCSHQHEPGCGVRVAIESGKLDGDRLQSYLKQKRELEYLARRQDVSFSLAEKAKWKRIHKMQRAITKHRESR